MIGKVRLFTVAIRLGRRQREELWQGRVPIPRAAREQRCRLLLDSATGQSRFGRDEGDVAALMKDLLELRVRREPVRVGAVLQDDLDCLIGGERTAEVVAALDHDELLVASFPGPDDP